MQLLDKNTAIPQGFQQFRRVIGSAPIVRTWQLSEARDQDLDLQIQTMLGESRGDTLPVYQTIDLVPDPYQLVANTFHILHFGEPFEGLRRYEIALGADVIKKLFAKTRGGRFPIWRIAENAIVVRDKVFNDTVAGFKAAPLEEVGQPLGQLFHRPDDV
jgi:hypothetical protein